MSRFELFPELFTSRYDPKKIPTFPELLGDIWWWLRPEGLLPSIGLAGGLLSPNALKKTARDMYDSVTIEVTIVLPEDAESHSLGMAEMPGGFMVKLGR